MESLAAREDAATILKLYELRQEPLLRQARAWMTGEYWPSSVEEVRALQADFGSEKNCWFRQVLSYWEMAAALVNHGILNMEIFLDTNGEPFFLAAKFWPMLKEIRATSPQFLVQIERLTERSQAARQRLESMLVSVEKRKAAALSRRR